MIITGLTAQRDGGLRRHTKAQAKGVKWVLGGIPVSQARAIFTFITIYIISYKIYFNEPVEIFKNIFLEGFILLKRPLKGDKWITHWRNC
jgi:hypothetical protein